MRVPPIRARNLVHREPICEALAPLPNHALRDISHTVVFISTVHLKAVPMKSYAIIVMRIHNGDGEGVTPNDVNGRTGQLAIDDDEGEGAFTGAGIEDGLLVC